VYCSSMRRINSRWAENSPAGGNRASSDWVRSDHTADECWCCMGGFDHHAVWPQLDRAAFFLATPTPSSAADLSKSSAWEHLVAAAHALPSCWKPDGPSSSSCRFHWLIWLGWRPCSVANSLNRFRALAASRATWNLNWSTVAFPSLGCHRDLHVLVDFTSIRLTRGPKFGVNYTVHIRLLKKYAETQ